MLRALGASFVPLRCLWVRLLIAPGETKACSEPWHFQSHPSSSREGRAARNGVNNGWGSESFRVGEHTHTRRVKHPKSTGTEALVLETLLDLNPYISSPGYSSLYPLSLSSVSYASELIQPEGCHNLQSIQQVGQKHK